MRSEAALAIVAVLMFFLSACGDDDVSPAIVDILKDPFGTVAEPVLAVAFPEADAGPDAQR